jgi:hypothetical protein
LPGERQVERRDITVLNTARKWLTAVAVAVAGVLLIPGSPANAAPAKGHICLKNSSSYCLQSNGVGNQVTITNNSGKYSVFTVKGPAITINGVTTFQWENASGNCLREDGDMVTIKDGGCSATDPADSWGDNGGDLLNEFFEHFMLVRGQPQTGFKVFAYVTVASGDWAKWSVP